MTSRGPDSPVLLDVTISNFQPPAMGSGSDRVKKKQEVAEALQNEIPAKKMEELRQNRFGRLVKVTVDFRLWKGSPRPDYTRFVKDLDSLLEVLFDSLKPGPPGIGIVESDSYICEVHASKKMVNKEDDEGFRLILTQHEDEETLLLLESYSVLNDE